MSDVLRYRIANFFHRIEEWILPGFHKVPVIQVVMRKKRLKGKSVSQRRGD